MVADGGGEVHADGGHLLTPRRRGLTLTVMSLPATRRPNRIVQGLDVYLLDIPMRRFRHAASHRRQAQSVLVNVRLSDQTGGWGETLPREYVTGETLESEDQVLDWVR